MRNGLVVSCLILAAIIVSGAFAAERAEWWSTEKEVTGELLRRNAGQWARQLHELPPDVSAAELMRRFSLFNRAGHLAHARTVIDALSDADIETAQLSAMADFLIGREDWETARYFLERVPQAEPGWGYVLIKHWSTTGDVKQIDQWLAERAKANPRYWFIERLRFRKDQGTEGELVAELVASVRRNPHDAEVALQYLEVTQVVRQSAEDIAWIGEICRPPSAYASLRLARSLRGAPRAEIALLEHSLKMPVTKEDEAVLNKEMAYAAFARPSPPPLEQMIRDAAKRDLLRVLQELGESARAQELLQRLAARQPDGLPPGGLDQLAGQVQAASGARVVQQNFREAEQENQESAEYWQRRAWYFKGRKEYAEAIAAYEKALQVALPDADDVTARHSTAVMRSSVLTHYVSLLVEAGQQETAVRLLDRELQQAPPGGIAAQRIVSSLLHGHDGLFPAVDHERLWAYLDARTEWDRTEELLMWRLVESAAKGGPLDWARAESLARDRHPSRSLVLGWVMTRSRAHARAIPWLKGALQRLEDASKRERAAFTLFEAYLDTGDWRGAEEMWPAGRQRLTPRELSEWLGRIAVIAARAGDQGDAMRLWEQRTNLDRAVTSQLDEMLRAGLRQQLVEFYRTLAQRDPDCGSIAGVLKRISG